MIASAQKRPKRCTKWAQPTWVSIGAPACTGMHLTHPLLQGASGPLYAAISGGHVSVLELLLKRGYGGMLNAASGVSLWASMSNVLRAYLEQ